jgi:hypothetical protein
MVESACELWHALRSLQTAEQLAVASARRRRKPDVREADERHEHDGAHDDEEIKTTPPATKIKP